MNIIKMASANDEFWTLESNSLLVDQRIAKDSVFRTSNSDQNGWLEVLAELRKAGAPKSLNRVHARRQWTKICEEYKKIAILSNGNAIDGFNVPYYAKLKLFFEKQFAQNEQKSNCSNGDNKMLTATLLKESSFRQCYADRWSVLRTKLLIDTRIAKDDFFKGRGHTAAAWQIVLADMMLLGEPDTLTVSQIKKKWENLLTRYQEILKSKSSKIHDWPYFEKIHDFMASKSIKNSDENSVDYAEEILIIKEDLESATLATDQNTTNVLIDARIARDVEFIGCENSDSAWQNVLDDMTKLGETQKFSIEELKNKWDDLTSKYYSLDKSDLDDINDWEYFQKLHDFFTRKNVSDKNSVYAMKNKCYADRWPTKRIKLLIKKRIAREPMFDGRKLSSLGWKAILEDMRAEGTPEDVTICQIKKKWENLCRKYKIIKANVSYNKKWPLWNSMNEYFKMKDVLIEDPELEPTPEKTSIEVKKTKCRLCQEHDIDYIFEDNNELCGKISECFAINVFENMDYLPGGICKKCQTSVDAFYPFVIHCRNVDKHLHETLVITPQANVKLEPLCEIDDEPLKSIKSSFECSECPVVFNSGESLEVHLKSHCNGSRYFCDMCNSSFSRQSALYAHIKTHFEVENMLVVLPENQPDTSNDHEDEEFEENVESARDLLEGRTCIVCRKAFQTRRALRDHLQTHSRTSLKCPREGCNKTYASFKSLENHEMKHLGLKSFLCVVCGKGFVTKNALQTHEKIHQEVKEFECNVCSVRFAVASNLRAHQKKHHEGVRFYCSQCPKEFLSKDSLNRHEIAHTGIKDFICDICSAAFYTAKELRKHKFYHDGTRMHHCNLCFKTFYEKHHLTVHMRSHTDERPYPCKVPGCGKAFRESQKLRRHMKQQHRLQS